MSGESGSQNAKWDDLQVRLMSAAVMLVAGLSAIWIGGIWFIMLVAFATGLMIWELASLCAPERPQIAVVLGVLATTFCFALSDVGGFSRLVLFAVIPILGAVTLAQRQVLFAIFAFAIVLATFWLIEFRETLGVSWILWLMFIIIASDTMGYLAGRMLGGPKFWPKVSPKKTWSGTIAGWVGAAIVGLIFSQIVEAQTTILMFVVISVVVAFAGQMGDIAESALKRTVGIKDSSDLIPGHGGLLDRFDAMLGAVLLLGIIVFIAGWGGF